MERKKDIPSKQTSSAASIDIGKIAVHFFNGSRVEGSYRISTNDNRRWVAQDAASFFRTMDEQRAAKRIGKSSPKDLNGDKRSF